MGIHISSNAKWSLTDSLEKQSWEFAATRETLSEQDMLCTPWLTINICFVFLMPTRGTYGPQTDGSWDWLERDAHWLFSALKTLFLICLRSHKQQLHGCVRHKIFCGGRLMQNLWLLTNNKNLYLITLFLFGAEHTDLNVCSALDSLTSNTFKYKSVYVFGLCMLNVQYVTLAA